MPPTKKEKAPDAMQNIVWIVSYPKSGNTWLRMFLARMIQAEKFSLKTVEKFSPNFFNRPNKAQYKKFSQKEIIENSKKWDGEQEAVSRNSKGVCFFKTHQAAIRVGDVSFPRLDFCWGFIYVIRDPRDILPSYAHHLNIDLDATLQFMFNEKALSGTRAAGFAEVLGSWRTHVRSWAAIKPRASLTIRYEDMSEKPLETFTGVCRFLGLPTDSDVVSAALEDVGFSRVKALEEEQGFSEASNGKPFFRRGKVGEWKSLDYEKFIAPLEAKFGDAMQAFGYLPASEAKSGG